MIGSLLAPASIDAGLGILADPYILLAIVLGTAVGVVFGAIPGFSATMTIVLFTPVTIPFEPTSALIFLVAAYGGAVYGGSIPAILINTPGAPGSVVTCWDGYELTKRGRAVYALAVSAIVSGIAGLFAAAVLLAFAPPISSFALNFGPPEMFLLAVFALTIIPAAKGASLSKALLAGAFGLLIGTIGNDPQLSQSRATFEQTTLLAGVDFIVVLIGLFVLTEVFRLAFRGTAVTDDERTRGGLSEVYEAARTVASRPIETARGMFIGAFIGSLPGAGADVANFVSYNEAKRWAGDELASRFGNGAIEGVIAADSSNNATQGGALIPTLTLGIPGSGSTAALLGAIALHGMNPGPGLFESSGDIVYAMILSLFVGNILILLYGVSGSQYFGKLAYVPVRYIIPAVTVLAIVGAFAVRNATVDLYIALLFGVIGILFVKYDYPLVSLVLGVILGDIAESGFVTGWLLTGESATAFLFNSYIAIGLLVLTVLSLVVTALKN